MAEMETVFVKAAEGRLVRDPVTCKQLDPAGETKPLNAFWRRRIRCGDCIAEGKAKATTATPPPKTEDKPKTKKAEDKPKPKKGDDK